MIISYEHGFTMQSGGWDRDPDAPWIETEATAVTVGDGSRYQVGEDGVDAITLVGDPWRDCHVEVYAGSGGWAVDRDEIRSIEIQ